ncbi:AraC-type DNA-binding protein [Oryzisolibacter propanilivorax]|uniref:AraC-type DNA-binding protein n=1 Tax=Oryzisolibacter propanilivorax TaxID=1527607 RepID=A0A1G9QRD4_9BURK|nr:helix-turn-helix domain-containing protein [Oryzisolibacter propanilivorax]SDM13411.1 AraC-type DNA-binding protein [Oryzisolibacter propanilivorax]
MFADVTPLCPTASVRRYGGEHQAHAHDHAQLLFALQGRMELEVAGRSAFVDSSCGLAVPAGAVHAFLARPDTRLFVIDAPPGAGLQRVRRFAVPPAAQALARSLGAAPQPAGAPVRAADACLALLLGAPRVLARRPLDVALLQAAVGRTLREPWPTARMARLYHLSAARFHARWLELTGATPQDWLRARRLDAAAQLLARGRPLAQAALATGYASASALAAALRRERGVGARALRAAQLQKLRLNSA